MGSTFGVASDAEGPPRIAIRAIAADEAEDVARLLRESIAELCAADHGGDGDVLRLWLENKTSRNIAAWIADPANVMLVAIVGDARAGACCLRTDGRIVLNYVAPTHRFSGVSRVMLLEMERRAGMLGLKTVVLECTKTAHRFYLRNGWGDVGPVVRKHGLEAFPMAKRLSGTGPVDGECRPMADE